MTKTRLALALTAVIGLLIAAVVVLLLTGGGQECREFILPDGTIAGCGEWR